MIPFTTIPDVDFVGLHSPGPRGYARDANNSAIDFTNQNKLDDRNLYFFQFTVSGSWDSLPIGV